MMANILLICLVFMSISAAVGTHANDHGHGIQQRKRACRNIGGQCIKKNRACPGDLTMETLPGKHYCKRRRRCCYPVPTTEDPLLEEVVCGIETLPATRIVGGVTIKDPRKYPWHVGIKNRISQTTKFYCGGTIITKKHILTAAHCFFELGGTPDCYKKVPKPLYVGYGSIEQDMTKPLLVSSVNTHYMYNCITYANDIAVLTLSNPNDLTGGIRPICLPTAEGNHVGIKATVIGWGSIVGYNPPPAFAPPPVYPNILKEALVPVINNVECTDKQICTSTGNGFDGKPKGSGACQGDSGGPLVVKDTESRQRYVQIGITSSGRGCAAKGHPDVLTRVFKYLEFIQNATTSETLYYLD